MILCIIAMVSIVSNVLVICGYGYQSYITPDMNPFNWAIFFLLGMLWKKYEEQVTCALRKWKYVIYLFFAVWSAIYLCADQSVTYWNWFSIPFEISGIYVLLRIAYMTRNIKSMQTIGMNTLFIYITHMIMAGWVMNHMPSTGIILLIRPVITIFILYIGILIVTQGCSILHLEKILPYIGMAINRRRD